jgi:hypothetical protein
MLQIQLQAIVGERYIVWQCFLNGSMQTHSVTHVYQIGFPRIDLFCFDQRLLKIEMRYMWLVLQGIQYKCLGPFQALQRFIRNKISIRNIAEVAKAIAEHRHA